MGEDSTGNPTTSGLEDPGIGTLLADLSFAARYVECAGESGVPLRDSPITTGGRSVL